MKRNPSLTNTRSKRVKWDRFSECAPCNCNVELEWVWVVQQLMDVVSINWTPANDTEPF